MGVCLRASWLLPILLASALYSVDSARAQTLDLSAYKGKVVYLDFWASWCAPCLLSFPWMNRMQDTLGREGFVVIAVNVDHDRDRADRFLQANPSGFKIVFDPTGTIATEHKLKDMPTSVLIGRDGKTRYVHSGFLPSREGSYLSDIRTLLNEKAP
jgi:cytochrome c biogenesis protein CcmG/thiol:disulfide interchange protein DsbE